jgi:hypothetical protein
MVKTGSEKRGEIKMGDNRDDFSDLEYEWEVKFSGSSDYVVVRAKNLRWPTAAEETALLAGLFGGV